MRDMNLGLGTILSHAELLLLYKDDAREKRAQARSRHPAGGARGCARWSRGWARRRWCPRRTARPPPPRRRGSASAAAASRSSCARCSLTAREPLDAQQISVDLRIPAGTLAAELPAPDPAPGAGRDLRGPGRRTSTPAFAGLRALRAQAGALARPPTGEVKRDFLMVALAHNGTLTAAISRGSSQGLDDGPLGQASRLFREMGGFVRFAPFPAERRDAGLPARELIAPEEDAACGLIPAAPCAPCAAAVAIVLIAGPRARAGGFALFEQGARSMGFAGAFTAQANDPSAIFHNAAGIAFLKGRQLSASGAILWPRTTFDGQRSLSGRRGRRAHRVPQPVPARRLLHATSSPSASSSARG